MSPKLLTVLLVLVPTFLYYGFIKPLHYGTTGFVWTPEYSIPQLQSQNVSYKNALNQITEVQRGAAKLNTDYLAVSPELKIKSKIMIPDEVNVLKLINEVKAIADNAGVSVGQVTVTEDKIYKNRNLGSYVVVFNLKARYPAFKKLMEAYEKNMRFYVINAISIKRPDEGQTGDAGVVVFDKEALTISVSFRVFYLKK